MRSRVAEANPGFESCTATTTLSDLALAVLISKLSRPLAEAAHCLDRADDQVQGSLVAVGPDHSNERQRLRGLLCNGMPFFTTLPWVRAMTSWIVSLISKPSLHSVLCRIFLRRREISRGILSNPTPCDFGVQSASEFNGFPPRLAWPPS